MIFTKNNYDQYQNKRLITFLMGMVILGSFFDLENSIQGGCIVGLSLFAPGNWIFLFFSVAMFIGILKSNSQKKAIFLCLIELIVWILKVLIYKGRYIFGFAGGPSFVHIGYDSLALYLRMELLRRLLVKNTHYRYFAIAITTLLIIVKINFFALPPYTEYRWRLADQRLER